MIPKVAKTGHSFKGAALYYLNDKGDRPADGRDAWQALRDELGDRVAHVETLNLPTDNAVSAIKHMIDTATHADELKAAAGIANVGRKGGKPVYAYSLAWHPTETPTMAEQMQAAKDTLKELGITDRQALIVAHNDTDHPHVHVIVNRVCPETGRMATMGNDQLKLSKWAESYERENGQVFCKEREKNNAKRSGEYVKDQSMTRQEWMAWKKGQTSAIWAEYRQDRDHARADRKGMYDALWHQKEERFALRKDEIKQLYKPMWRDMFKRQQLELKEYDSGFVGRMRAALRHGQTPLGAVTSAMFNGQTLRGELIAHHAQERSDLGRQHRQRVADASREVTKAYKYDRDQLRQVHRDQDKARLEDTKSRTDAIWKDKTRPTAREQADDAQKNFDQSADRRRSENKQRRDSLDAFSDKDRDYIQQAREEQRRQSERNKRKRSRTRKRDDGGRTMDR